MRIVNWLNSSFSRRRAEEGGGGVQSARPHPGIDDGHGSGEDTGTVARADRCHDVP